MEPSFRAVILAQVTLPPLTVSAHRTHDVFATEPDHIDSVVTTDGLGRAEHCIISAPVESAKSAAGNPDIVHMLWMERRVLDAPASNESLRHFKYRTDGSVIVSDIMQLLDNPLHATRPTPGCTRCLDADSWKCEIHRNVSTCVGTSSSCPWTTTRSS